MSNSKGCRKGRSTDQATKKRRGTNDRTKRSAARTKARRTRKQPRGGQEGTNRERSGNAKQETHAPQHKATTNHGTRHPSKQPHRQPRKTHNSNQQNVGTRDRPLLQRDITTPPPTATYTTDTRKGKHQQWRLAH